MKEKWRKDAVITIRTLYEEIENPKNHFAHKERLINVEIKNNPYIVSQSFSINKTGTKKMFKFIKGELYLK